MAALRLTISRQEETHPKKAHPQKKTHYLSRSFFGLGLNKEKKRIKEAYITKRAATLRMLQNVLGLPRRLSKYRSDLAGASRNPISNLKGISGSVPVSLRDPCWYGLG